MVSYGWLWVILGGCGWLLIFWVVLGGFSIYPYYYNVNVLLRITGGRMDFRLRKFYYWLATTFYYVGLIQIQVMLSAILQQRYRQRRANRLLMSISRRYFDMKRFSVNSRQPRQHWIIKGHTNAWWQNFVDNQVHPSEWKGNFRMSSDSFLEFCGMLRPYLTKKSKGRRGFINCLTLIKMYYRCP